MPNKLTSLADIQDDAFRAANGDKRAQQRILVASGANPADLRRDDAPNGGRR